MILVRNPRATGVYVHFPWCYQKCRYCDFYSVGLERARATGAVPPELLQQYEAGIIRELESRLDSWPMRTINSIYFGGGVASLMPAATLANILQRLRCEFELLEQCEITLEGNPESFTAEYLRELEECGITRVNVGIQSFDEALLKSMGRYYSPGQSERVLELLSRSSLAAGVDLIYGFPGQTEAGFHADLARALEANVEHLSLYALTAEPNAPYHADINSGRSDAPDEELQFRLFTELPGFLADRGFEHYEISNFARAQKYSRHNLRYWLYEPYLGLGPGAHGFSGKLRYANVRDFEAWSRAPASAPTHPHDPRYELPLNLLRLCVAFDPALFREVFDVERSANAAEQTLARWVAKGLGEFVSATDGRFTAGALCVTGEAGTSRELFQWKPAGLLYLDDRILEMIEALANER